MISIILNIALLVNLELMSKYITKYTLDFRDIRNTKDILEVLAVLEKIISPYVRSGTASDQIVWMPYQPLEIPPQEGGLFVLEREWTDEARARNFCVLINTIISLDTRAAFCGPWVMLEKPSSIFAADVQGHTV
jgi:hypothetical protein